MKYLGYVVRNIRRNPIRTSLTIASISVCLFLLMVLLSFISVNDDVAKSLSNTGRMITMSSQGFAQPVPVANIQDIAAMNEVATVGELTPQDSEFREKKAITPYQFYGGKYKEESIMGAQFGVDPATIFAILEEFTVPADQIQAFRADNAGCVIGRKLADEKKIKIGDPYPLKSEFYNFNLNLTVRGIYDAPSNRDQRTCFYHWDYLNEGLKRDARGAGATNAGTIYFKCKAGTPATAVIKRIDDGFRNSPTPTKTQTEEAFAQMFNEMVGDLQTYINAVGIAVTAALTCVCAVAMAMAMRERTGEIAVLKAIGFGRGLVLSLVLTEAVIVAGLGGLVGAIGSKLLFDKYDLSQLVPAFLPFFYIPLQTALLGLAGSLAIGLISGIIPAWLAARMPVKQGLRKVV